MLEQLKIIYGSNIFLTLKKLKLHKTSLIILKLYLSNNKIDNKWYIKGLLTMRQTKVGKIVLSDKIYIEKSEVYDVDEFISLFTYDNGDDILQTWNETDTHFCSTFK